MEIVKISKHPNESAIEMLKKCIAEVESGEIITVGISWVTKDSSISGDVSAGEHNLLMWAALEHSARSFYEDIIIGENND